MKITQLYVSYDILAFGEHMKKKFHLDTYHDDCSPAIFFGCYRREDIAIISQHKSIAVVIWAGSDAMNPQLVDLVGGLKRGLHNPVFHIATSSFIENDLRRASVPFLRFNYYPKDEKIFTPVPIGNKVYIYSCQPRSDSQCFYGFDYIPVLKEAFPETEFIIQYSNPSTVSFEKMPEIYSQVAVGLRLVPHDGCSCTVLELGFMGRKCLWNGCLPNAIPYNSIDDIISSIKKELSRTGETDFQISEYCKRAIAGNSWLETSTYTSLLNRGWPNEKLVQ
jgi:hypothetical protein